jgi:cytochrome c oxidase subunit III
VKDAMAAQRMQVLDVSGLETFGFGSRGVSWWGVNVYIAIEGTMLLLCLASYFYLESQAPEWPIGRRPPDLGLATLDTLLLLASVPPMVWTERAARCMDLHRIRRGLLVCIAIGIAFSVVRALEIASLPFRWNTNVYWSLIWVTVGLHTGHLIAEVLETMVIAAALSRGGEIEPKLFVDVEDNALYWYFIVAVWLPVYAVVFLSPRFLGTG